MVCQKNLMNKIIVIGCPGSGKSRLSRKLRGKLEIPLWHLDMLYWNSDRTTVEKKVFLERLSAVLEKDKWIVDGNYMSTMEQRLDKCDTVIFLDFSTDDCILGVKERMGKPRDDMPWIETEEDREFIEFIRSFNDIQRPVIVDLLERYGDKNIVIFKSREEVDEFLEEL